MKEKTKTTPKPAMTKPETTIGEILELFQELSNSENRTKALSEVEDRISSRKEELESLFRLKTLLEGSTISPETKPPLQPKKLSIRKPVYQNSYADIIIAILREYPNLDLNGIYNKFIGRIQNPSFVKEHLASILYKMHKRNLLEREGERGLYRYSAKK